MKNKIVIVATLFVFISQLQAQNENYTKELNKGYQGAIIKDIKYLKNALNFAVLGDWGRYGNLHQKAVAEQLSGAMAGIDGDFIISTGDNFYPSGVKSIHDPSWKYSFEDVYTSYHLHRDWYVILGNHDYVTNPEAQVEYSNISARWKLPSKYYSFKKNIQGPKKKHVEFFMVDTSPLQPDYYEGDFI
jgi:tartrate-resistant acid phosphatase type 5